MYKVCSIFSQVLTLFSRGEFEMAVKEHKTERHARGFTSWGQFVAMLFCQLGRAHSLREICGSGIVLKELFLSFWAAALRAVAGFMVAARVLAKELLILDERDGPAARLKPDSEGTVLQIYAEGLNPAISLGVQGHPPLRFLRFFGEGGEQVAGFGARLPTDMRPLSRAAREGFGGVLGAFPDADIPLNLPVDEWGLHLTKPHSRETLFGA